MISIIKDVIGLIKFLLKYRKEKWYQSGRDLTKKIKAAKTNKTRKRYVRELSDHIKRL